MNQRYPTFSRRLPATPAHSSYQCPLTAVAEAYAVEGILKANSFEVTTLVVLGLNDDEAMLRRETEWLAGESKEIALHLSRFFPRYHMLGVLPTEPETIHRFARVAREYLPYVYEGNL